MKTQLILILVTLLFCSCAQIPPDEELTITRTPYNGNEIRLDGCYIGDNKFNNRCEYNFFYSNGVFFVFSDLFYIENVSQFTGGIDNLRKYKSCWGVFQVEPKTIKAQRWKYNDVLNQLILQNRVYKIMNDTTLSIDLLNDGDVTYYHFKHFLPKPDSTNIFISLQ